MPPDIVHEDNPALARIARKTTPAAALAALGIVYGDLGTSPLYTLQAVVGATGGHFSPEAALGSLSLIFWALIITISVKYCLFVMRADNHGEGGILALMSMTGANWSNTAYVWHAGVHRYGLMALRLRGHAPPPHRVDRGAG